MDLGMYLVTCFSLGNISLQGMWWMGWEGEALATALAALPPQCTLVYGYHYSFNMFWQKTSRWVLALSWKEMCWGGQGPSNTVVLEDMFSLAVWLVLFWVWLKRFWWVKGWQDTSILSLSCPTTPMYDIWSVVLKTWCSPSIMVSHSNRRARAPWNFMKIHKKKGVGSTGCQ